MFALAFWKAAVERATKTAAQAALVQLVVGDGFNAFDADWGTAGGFALGGAVASLLFSLISIGVGGPGPSLGAETLTPAVAAVEKPDAGTVAGPAADLPEDTPVEVVPAVGDGLGTAVTDVADSIYGADPKTDATYLGRGE